jgi:hypothetical protein
MPLYAIDVRERVIRRVTREYDVASNTRYSLIVADSAKQAWSKAMASATAPARAECEDCRHRHCMDCAECSVAKEYSDYWICHCCGTLNLRVRKLL